MNKSLDSLLGFFRQKKAAILMNIVAILVIFATWCCLRHCFKPVILFDPKIHPVESILLRSRKVAPPLAAQHNALLISILVQRESAYIGYDTGEEGLMWQARLFYAAIVAGLSVTLLTGNKKRRPTQWVLMFIIFLMYFVEIHLQDVATRARASTFATAEGIDFLANANQADSTWFSLNYSKLSAQQEQASRTHLCRKLTNALYPDVIQIAFYVLPFLILLLYVSNGSPRKKSDGTKTDQYAGS